MTEFWEIRLSKALRALRCRLLGHIYTKIVTHQEVRHTQEKRNLYGRVTSQLDETLLKAHEMIVCRRCHKVFKI